MITALSILTVLAPLFLVLFVRRQDVRAETSPASNHLDERRSAVYENLRDLQFEFLAGKLSETDYQTVKRSLQKEIAALSAAKASVAEPDEKCAACGATRTSHMKYCGNCGKAFRIGVLLLATFAHSASAFATQRALILEPVQDRLQVTEALRFEAGEKIDAFVHVPRAAQSSTEVTIDKSAGAPQPFALRATEDPEKFRVASVSGRGAATIELRYSMPLSSTFSNRNLTSGPLRIVSSRDLALSADGLRPLGQEPSSQANLYELTGVGMGESFKLRLSATRTETPQRRQPTRGPAKVLQRGVWLALLISVLLAVSGALLYRDGLKARGASPMDRAMLATVLTVLIGLLFVTNNSHAQRAIAIGDKAPDFSIRTDDGRELKRDDFGGKLLVLNFWATWCPPCIQEIPSLSELTESLRGQSVTVLAVSIDEQSAEYAAFLRRLRTPFLTSRDAGGELAAAFGTFKVPETYIIGRDGRVLQKFVDARDWTDPLIMREIQSFLR